MPPLTASHGGIYGVVFGIASSLGLPSVRTATHQHLLLQVHTQGRAGPEIAAYVSRTLVCAVPVAGAHAQETGNTDSRLPPASAAF